MAKLTKAEARKTWEAAAPGWVAWEDVLASGFRDATAQMLDIAAVAPGAKVLDLACGAGSQTFQAAERVGADGTIVASDISTAMLSHTGEANARTDSICRTTDGFALAEVDLKLRGSGELLGTRQSGWGELRALDPVEDLELLLRARSAVKEER